MTIDWQKLRAEFPVTAQWAFFDHAAVAPLSGRARQAMIDWATDQANHGGVREKQWMARVEVVRKSFGRLLNADPLDIAFIKNTSEGIGFVAEGFPWKAGDNVVTALEEYPSNQYPWLNLQSRGVEVRRVASGPDGRLEIDDLISAMDARTRLLSLSFVEYASGFRNDLATLGQLCRERGIFFFVDAIQGLGAVPLDVQKTPIDFLAADGHKWLLGPEGAGIFYIRREIVDMIHTVGVGWNSVVGALDFGKIDFQLKPHAGRWESGSLNVAGITGLGASLELLLEVGIESVRERVFELTDYLCERVAHVDGLTVYSSRLPQDKSGIVSVNLDDPASAWKIVQRCREQGIVINKRAGRLRISPHFYNTQEEVERLLRCI